MSSKVVLFVANRGFALLRSRVDIIQYFLNKRWTVVVLSDDSKESHKLVQLGVVLEKIHVYRGGFSLSSEIRLINRIYSIYKKWNPNLLHHFHLKPIVIGSFIGRMLGGDNVRIVNTVTGLGYSYGSSLLAGVVLKLAYTVSSRASDITIFQNEDDMSLFIQNKYVSEYASRLIVGSGVDVEAFFPWCQRTNAGDQPYKVLMISRLLHQKGVKLYIDVVKSLEPLFPDVEFQLGGEVEDVHPDRIIKDDLDEWLKGSSIHVLGYVSDVAELLRNTDLLIFPSFYREGVPRIVLEAMSSGVPAIVANVPGSRDAVIDGVTGFVVEPKSHASLKHAVEKVLTDDELRYKMAISSREYALDRFDIKKITLEYIGVYKALCDDL